MQTWHMLKRIKMCVRFNAVTWKFYINSTLLDNAGQSFMGVYCISILCIYFRPLGAICLNVIEVHFQCNAWAVGIIPKCRESIWVVARWREKDSWRHRQGRIDLRMWIAGLGGSPGSAGAELDGEGSLPSSVPGVRLFITHRLACCYLASSPSTQTCFPVGILNRYGETYLVGNPEKFFHSLS